MPYSNVAGITPGIRSSQENDNRVYSMKQFIDYGTILTSSAGGEVDFARAFTFSDLQSVGSFQAVFDQYKIDKIELWIWPSNAPVSGSFGSYSRWLSVIDYDDTAALTANSLLQYQNCVELSANSALYREFRPHIALLGQSSGNINVPSKWIDCAASSSVPHYGLKIVSYSTAITFTLNMRACYHMSFRNNI